MNIEMVPLQIIGLKSELQPFIHTLRLQGCVQIEELAEAPETLVRQLALDRDALRAQEELIFLVARLEGLLDELSKGQSGEKIHLIDDCLEEARESVETLLPKVQTLTSRREKLEAEVTSLPRYEATLRKLLPIIPPSARSPENVTIGVLVSRAHVGVLDSIGKRILDLTSVRAEVVASDVDASTRTMLIVFPREDANEIEALLGREDVSRLRLPAELGEGPLERELAGLDAAWSGKLTAWRDALRDRLNANSILSDFGETDMTFVMTGWVPKQEFEKVKSAIQETNGDTVLVRQLPLTPQLKKRAPVALQNPRPAQPFESLVNLLALPRYGHIDPTRLMALFLPIFFGMILGDVGYGVLLLTLSLFFQRKFKSGVLRDILIVLAMGAGWSILFGFLYGEAFGTLGEHLGMHALWFDRASSEHVSGFLLMSLAVGAVHITLGLMLGIREAVRDKSRSHLLERGGMFLGLTSLFLLVGVLAEFLPGALRTPAWAGIITGIVLMSASMGWLGLLMGPIEFIGLIGNVLSYLRIAAIGLASVYLAKVANDVAGTFGNLIVGTILAILIHALNLVLGAFSPTIHSLRLHYVEFFRKFYEGGGRPYEPFRSQMG